MKNNADALFSTHKVCVKAQQTLRIASENSPSRNSPRGLSAKRFDMKVKMINDLADKFKRAGGMDTLGQYTRAHVLGFAALQTMLQGTSQKSLEIVRLSVSNRVQKKLRKKYRGYIEKYLQRDREKQAKRAQSPLREARISKVWMFWSDGEENAPLIVRKCIESVRENLPDREVIVLTGKTYKEYVTFPDFIEQRIDSGEMLRAHMADLLRLELLIRYGGTWIDATVLCASEQIPGYMLDSDLFLFQDLKPGLDGHCQRISNWLITARPGQPILRLTRALLYEYWKEHVKCEDYFIFHHFFEMALDAYPEEWAKVVPFSNAAPHILLLRLFDPYDDRIWKAVREMTPFHKLTYKFDESKAQIPGTYYQELFGSGDEGTKKDIDQE